MTPEQIDAGITAALAFGGGTHTLDDVLLGIAAGQFTLWTGQASVIVSEVVQYPQLRELNVFLAAGDMHELRRMVPHVLDAGLTAGCQRAIFTGRRGWERSPVVREDGWEPRWTTCVMTLHPLTTEDLL